MSRFCTASIGLTAKNSSLEFLIVGSTVSLASRLFDSSLEQRAHDRPEQSFFGVEFEQVVLSSRP
jgi:hypothetical protein